MAHLFVFSPVVSNSVNAASATRQWACQLRIAHAAAAVQRQCGVAHSIVGVSNKTSPRQWPRRARSRSRRPRRPRQSIRACINRDDVSYKDRAPSPRRSNCHARRDEANEPSRRAERRRRRVVIAVTVGGGGGSAAVALRRRAVVAVGGSAARGAARRRRPQHRRCDALDERALARELVCAPPEVDEPLREPLAPVEMTW